MGAALLLFSTWSQGHPAETNAESWRQARVLILGAAVSGALLANALVANAAAALKGPHRLAAGALLAAWLVAGALAAWMYTRR